MCILMTNSLLLNSEIKKKYIITQAVKPKLSNLSYADKIDGYMNQFNFNKNLNKFGNMLKLFKNRPGF